MPEENLTPVERTAVVKLLRDMKKPRPVVPSPAKRVESSWRMARKKRLRR